MARNYSVVEKKGEKKNGKGSRGGKGSIGVACERILFFENYEGHEAVTKKRSVRLGSLPPGQPPGGFHA